MFTLRNKSSNAITFTQPSKTEQAHKSDCDIQTILKKYQQHGVIQHNHSIQGTYGDYINAPDFTEAQNLIAEAKSMFETVPARIRADFDNDPAKFLEFTQNEANRERMIEYGFIAPDSDLIADPIPTPKKTPKTSHKPKEEPTEPSEDAS